MANVDPPSSPLHRPVHKTLCKQVARLKREGEKGKATPGTHATRPWLQSFEDLDDLTMPPGKLPPGLSNSGANTLARSPELRGLLPGVVMVKFEPWSE